MMSLKMMALEVMSLEMMALKMMSLKMLSSLALEWPTVKKLISFRTVHSIEHSTTNTILQNVIIIVFQYRIAGNIGGL